MVLMSEIPDRVKNDKDVVLDFKKTAVETGNRDVVHTADRKSLDENWRKDQHGVNMNFCEKQPMDVVGDSDVPGMDKESFSRKRKLQCYWCQSMLDWVRNLAKDPCNPAIGELPERDRWKLYGSELPWKQVLSTRELMLLKMQVETPQQKKQKMHPSMYEDDPSSYERIRCSRRILAAKDPSLKSSLVNPSSVSCSSGLGDEICSESDSGSAFWFIDHPRKRLRIGPQFQADLPKSCDEKNYTSDSKWLGTRVWPLDTSERNKSFLIERDPIGKGRALSCGCQFPGHPECVGFHIREKRMKSMLELGSAFQSWSLDNMGEYVALSWTKKDEKKFQNIVETNRLSSDKSFWDELFKIFPGKGREALVSYYFNVFLVRRRSEQNRSSTGDIYSDDEESEFGPIANRFGQPAAESKDSIFCSPKKTTHSNTR